MTNLAQQHGNKLVAAQILIILNHNGPF